MTERNEVSVLVEVRGRRKLRLWEGRWRNISCTGGFGLGTQHVALLTHARDEYFEDGLCSGTTVLH